MFLRDRQKFYKKARHLNFSAILAHHGHDHVMFWYVMFKLNPASLVFGFEMSLVCGTNIVINMSCHLGVVFKGLLASRTAISVCIRVYNHVGDLTLISCFQIQILDPPPNVLH